jgi:hypothetical protein
MHCLVVQAVLARGSKAAFSTMMTKIQLGRKLNLEVAKVSRALKWTELFFHENEDQMDNLLLMPGICSAILWFTVDIS